MCRWRLRVEGEVSNAQHETLIFSSTSNSRFYETRFDGLWWSFGQIPTAQQNTCNRLCIGLVCGMRDWYSFLSSSFFFHWGSYSIPHSILHHSEKVSASWATLNSPWLDLVATNSVVQQIAILLLLNCVFPVAISSAIFRQAFQSHDNDYNTNDDGNYENEDLEGNRCLFFEAVLFYQHEITTDYAIFKTLGSFTMILQWPKPTQHNTEIKNDNRWLPLEQCLSSESSHSLYFFQ